MSKIDESPVASTPELPEERKRKRRSHNKSRMGCMNCKKLRVKCDEVHPQCTNCVKRNRECIYPKVPVETKKKAKKPLSSPVSYKRARSQPQRELESHVRTYRQQSQSEDQDTPSPVLTHQPQQVALQSHHHSYHHDNFPHFSPPTPPPNHLKQSPLIDFTYADNSGSDTNSLISTTGFGPQLASGPMTIQYLDHVSGGVANDVAPAPPHLIGHSRPHPPPPPPPPPAPSDEPNQTQQQHFEQIYSSDFSPESVFGPPVEYTRPSSRSSGLSTPTPNFAQPPPAYQVPHQQQFITAYSQQLQPPPPPPPLPVQAQPVVLTEFETRLFSHYRENFREIVMVHDDSEVSTWQSYVPELAMKTPALANGILATAALHMERKSPGADNNNASGYPNLTEYAFSKYTETVTMFRDLQQTETGVEEAVSTLACSVFIMVLSYCFYEKIPLISHSEHGFDLVAVTRGPMVICKTLWATLMQSSVAEVVNVRINIEDPDPDNEYCEPVSFVDYLLESCDALEQIGFLDRNKEKYLGGVEYTEPSDGGDAAVETVTRFDQIDEFLDTNAMMPGEEQQQEQQSTGSESNGPVYKKALHQLKLALKCAAHDESASMIMNWPMRLESDFLSLARANYPFARIIMLYFLVALRSIRGYFWVGQRPDDEIKSLISDLGTQWQSFYAWPCKMLQADDYDLTNIWSYFTDGAGPYDLSMIY